MSNHLPTPEEREIENARIIDRCLNPDMLPFDWDSEEAQGTAEELRAEASKRPVNTLYGDLARA